MEGKDNRSRDKRYKMKSHYRNKSKYCTTSSSSGQMETMRGYVDVVDSSDERFLDRNDWIKGGAKIKAKKTYDLGLDDLPIEDEENEQMRAGDFDLMSQLPPAVGGHFKFSSEKQWEQAETEKFLGHTEANEYFTFNLKLINVGLQTIPFYKRMDYASSMFTNEQLMAMEQAAEEAERTYQSVLKDHIENPGNRINSASRKTNSAKSQKSVKEQSPEAPDDLDELLNITADQMSKASVNSVANTPADNLATSDITTAADAGTTATANNTDDIQKWLDDVLEE